MILRGVATATILGTALAACALDSAGTIIGETTSTAAGASGGTGAAGGSGASNPGSGGTGPGGASSSSTGPGPGGSGGNPTCSAEQTCTPLADSYALVLPGGSTCPAGWDAGAPHADSETQPGCQECFCGDASGVTCESVFKVGGDCTGNFTNDDGCHPTSGNNLTISVTQPAPQGGGCTESGGGKVPFDPPIVCAAAAGGACENGGSCAPAAAQGELCLVAAQCPSGYVSRPMYPVLEDGRTCGCACGAPQGSCDGGSVFIKETDCDFGSAASVAMDGLCREPPPNWFNGFDAVDTDLATFSGSCGVQPEMGGPVTFGAALTLCCPG